MGQVAGIAFVWFIIEMLLWYLIADNLFSGWYVFGWFILAIIIGAVLIIKSMAVLNPVAKQMQSGGMMNPSMRPNEDSMMKTVSVAISGILLVIPGLLSDCLALLVLLPPVQKKIKKTANQYIMNNQQKMMDMMMKQMGGQVPGGMGNMGQNPFGNMGTNPFGANSPFGNMKGNTVDGTAKTVQKEIKTIKPANDE